MVGGWVVVCTLLPKIGERARALLPEIGERAPGGESFNVSGAARPRWQEKRLIQRESLLCHN